MITEEVCSLIMDKIETSVCKWHKDIVEVLGKCKNKRKTSKPCRLFGYPDKSCDVCQWWGSLIECIFFEPAKNNIGDLKWDCVSVPTFSTDPVEIIKLFIVRSPDRKPDPVHQFEDVDARGILQILGSISLLLDDDKKGLEKVQLLREKFRKHKCFPVEEIGDDEKDTEKKMEILKIICRVSQILYRYCL